MSAMENGHKPTFPQGDMILEALRAGVRRELRIHKALGNPIAIWKDGKVTLIPPKEIQIDDPPGDTGKNSA